MTMALFTLAMLMALALHFTFARREWKRSRGKAATDIGITYVLREDYLGRSFREKAAKWIAGARQDAELHDRGRGDKISLRDECRIPGGEAADDVLVVSGALQAEAAAAFHKEVWVKGDALLGAGCVVRAMAVDGNLRLGANSRVERWLDCLGSIDVEPGCSLSGRTSCRGEIRIDASATAASLYARSIIILPRSQTSAEPFPADGVARFEGKLDFASDAGLKEAGVDPRRLRKLSADTWLYKGDLKPSGAVSFDVKLLVRGSCRLAPGSSARDLKVTGDLELGEQCECKGALIARGNIAIGCRSIVSAPVFSGAALRVSSGVRAGDPDHRVALYGEDKVELASGVVVHGKVSSAGAVSAVRAQQEGSQLPRPVAPLTEGSASAFRTGAAGVLIAMSIAVCPARAQSVAASEQLPRVRLELGGFASHVDHGYGNWRGYQGQLTLRASSFFVPILGVESQSRPLGRQQNYTFFSYLNWSSRFYTTVGAGVAPQDSGPAIYYPRNRQDVKAFVKVGSSRNVVLDGGFTRFDFGKPGRGQIYSAGLIVYSGKAVVEGNVFVNRNQPNNLVSASGLVSAQYGREGHYWVGIEAGGGRELYNYVGIAPIDVKLFSYSLQLFCRKWITRNVGIKASLFHVNKLEAYSQAGAAASMFFEF